MKEEDLEEKTLNDKECRFSVIIGTKGSGKTFLSVKLIEYYYSKNKYSAYFLILPSYKTENGAKMYENIKKMENTFVFTDYHPAILVTIKATRNAKKYKGKPVLFFYDDSTSNAEDLSNDQEFLKLITQCRHQNFECILITHTLKKVLVPAVRNNIDRLYIFKIANLNLKKQLHEEFTNDAFIDVKEFRNYLAKRTDENTHFSMMIDNNLTAIDKNVNDWKILKKIYRWK